MVNFAELQRLSMNEGNEVAESRKKLDAIAEFFRGIPRQDEFIEFFAKLRHNFPKQALVDAGAFAVPHDYNAYMLPEELRHESLGFCRDVECIYAGRFVYPVYDTKGHVAGWCGYDPYEQPKYLDSTNFGYSAKNGLFYGSEKLPEYYRSGKPVIVVEGIVCCLWLRSQGFQSLASLGSYLTPYMVTVLKRFGRNCIVIPDADEAGTKYRAQVKRQLPIAKCVQSCVAKDIDDSRKVNPNLAEEVDKIIKPFGTSKCFA